MKKILLVAALIAAMGANAEERTPNTLPAGVETEKWTMNYDGGAAEVSVAIDGDHVYLTSLNPSFKSGVIIGTIEGDQATFPLQFMNYDYSDTDDGSAPHEMWFQPMGAEGYTDALVMSYDAEAETFIAALEDGYCIRDAVGYKYDMRMGIAIMSHAAKTTIYPAAPTDVKIGDCADPSWGTGDLTFTLPVISGGIKLNLANLYWNMYLDDSAEPYEFTPAKHVMLTKPMVNVPYNFSDDCDFYCWGADAQQHEVLIQEPYTRVGVQSVYEVDGIMLRSDIVYTDGSIATGIENVAAKAGEVKYYDLTGRQVTNPQGGIFVRVSGGKAVKVLK